MTARVSDSYYAICGECMWWTTNTSDRSEARLWAILHNDQEHAGAEEADVSKASGDA